MSDLPKGQVLVTSNPDNANKRISYKQIGSTGLRRYSGYIYEEFIPDLRWPYAGRIYQEMSDNDPTIGAILYLAEMLIRGAGWSVKPASDKPIDVEAAQFLKSCMDDMEITWANTICEVLSMMKYGFSFHELVYKIRRGPFESSPKYRSKYSDGRIGWRKIPVRSQRSLLEWEFDDEGNVTAFVQQAEPDFNIVTIPMSKGLLFRTSSIRENPEGRSLLRNAYRPWYFKKHFEEIEGIGIERDLAGFPVLQAPEGLDLWNDKDPEMVKTKASAERLVASVRRDAEEGVLLPAGWDLKLLSSTSSRQIDIGATIDRYDKRIAITLLSDIILLGDKSGSFALADAKQSMLAAALQAQLGNIADTFNGKAVPDLFYMNNFDGITDFPKIEPGQIQTPSLKEVALILRAWGVKLDNDFDLTNYIRKICGFPEISKEDFEKQQKLSAQESMNARVNNKTTTDPNKNDKNTRDDTAERDLEQNDLAYTGAGGE
jgi:hypothetical protein